MIISVYLIHPNSNLWMISTTNKKLIFCTSQYMSLMLLLVLHKSSWHSHSATKSSTWLLWLVQPVVPEDAPQPLSVDSAPVKIHVYKNNIISRGSKTLRMVHFSPVDKALCSYISYAPKPITIRAMLFWIFCICIIYDINDVIMM